MDFSDVVLQNEVYLKPEKEVFAYLEKIYKVMNSAIERGMKKHGTLPGGLEVRRRAPDIYDRLKERFLDNKQDGLEVIDWINLWGFAGAEENAAGGRVVTAPTMGPKSMPDMMIGKFSNVTLKRPFPKENRSLPDL